MIDPASEEVANVMKTTVVLIQNGPYKSGLLLVIEMNLSVGKKLNIILCKTYNTHKYRVLIFQIESYIVILFLSL